ETRSVHGKGFLTEYVLFGIDRCLQMGRTESGRRSKKYHVNIRSDEFLVSIKTDKPVALGDLYFVPHLFSYRIVGLLKLVAESICHGRQNNIWVCIQSFHSRSRATASAAYQ